MSGARKRETVVDAVGAIGRHRTNVRGGDFGAAATVDEFETGHCAALVIGGEHGGAKDAVANDARGQDFGANALLLEAERAWVIVKRGRQWGGRIANARQGAFVVAKAEVDDANKVALAERAHGRLRIGQIAFDKRAIDRSRNIVRKVEIGVGLDQREIMPFARGVGNDLIDPGDGVKTPAAGLDGFIIDRPIAFELAGA